MGGHAHATLSRYAIEVLQDHHLEYIKKFSYLNN
jgi:hypothetical protein